jgi:uncharacterized delta-60 repeat protein
MTRYSSRTRVDRRKTEFISRIAAFTTWLCVAFALNAAPVQQVWDARYNGPANREDLMSAMTIDGLGRVYVTGSSDNNANPDPYATIKYDTNGAQLWVARYAGPRQIDFPIAIALDSGGNVYVTGFSHGTAQNYDPDYATVKYSPNGAELWAVRYNGHTNSASTADNPRALVVNNMGEVYVTGASVNEMGSVDFATIKYNTNGAQLWLQRYEGTFHGEDSPRAMGIDAAGNIYVVGSSQGSGGNWEIVLIKYSPTGEQAWVSHFSAPGHRAEDIKMKVDAAGNCYIAVFMTDGGPGWIWRLNLLKYNASGELVWRTKRRAISEDEQIGLAGMQLDDSNNICLVATVVNIGAPDYLTMKFNSSGEPLWSSRYNSPSGNEDSARAIAVDGGGNIYVTGLSYPEGNRYQFTTIKYRPNGHREWITSTTQPDNSGTSAGAVEVDTSGNVYVSGSVGLVGTKDYYAVKYQQLPQPGAPVITVAPTPQTVTAGGTATLSVSATGDQPLRYQWRRNGQAIGGATNATLVLSNLSYEQRGQYSVDVVNDAGATASPEALLNVLISPFIVDQSASRTVLLGSAVDFFVIVAGSEPFAYQWYHNSAPIAGATNSILVVSNLQPADAGFYEVSVSNMVGSTNGAPITLAFVPGVEQCFLAGVPEADQYYNFPQVMRLDAQGRAHVTQTVWARSGASQFYTLQFNTNGAVLWSARFTQGTNLVNNVQGLALDNAGNVYVAGSFGTYQQGGIAVVKYNSAGDQIWVATHRGEDSRFDQAAAIAVDSNGNVYVTGSADREDSPQRFLTVKFDASGAEQWAAEYRSSSNSTDVASDIQVDATGAVYVFGISLQTLFELTTVKYSTDGEVVWVRRHPAGSEGLATALKLDHAGNVIVTGGSAEIGYDTDYVTLKYDSNGNLLWLAQYQGILDGYDRPYALAIDSSNNVYVAGSSGLPGEQNTDLTGFATVKYDANGNQLWVASRVDAASYGGRDSLDVDAMGNVYTTFSKYLSPGGADFVTYKYDRQGTRIWTAITGRIGPQDEYASSVAVDGEGRLLVSGIGTSPVNEVLLVKYKNRETPGLPLIIEPPQDRDVREGASVTFTVVATGNSLLYQWYLNSTAINGATNASYSIENARTNRAGHYAVEVRNDVGAVLSRSAALTISVPPTIVRQPTGRSVLEGSDVTFEVSVTGSRPLNYQWRHNGTNIPGANAAIFQLFNVRSEDGGAYSVVVSNRVGSAISAGAMLSVNHNARREWLVVLGVGDLIHLDVVDMEVDGAGNVYVTGFTDGTPQRYITAKYNSSGEQQWVNEFGYSGGASAAALAVDQAGNAYVTGSAWDENGALGYATVKYGPSGNQLWVREFRPPEQAQAFDISIGANGHIYVTGEAGGATNGITTIKYDANGVQGWVGRYGGNGQGRGHRVVADAAGSAYVLGRIYNSGPDVVLVKHDAAGSVLWAKLYGDSGNDDPVDLKLDSQGNVIVCINISTWDARIAVAKYNAVGVLQWTNRFGYRYGVDVPQAMVLDAEDNIYITGYAMVGYIYEEGTYYQNDDIVTLKFSSAGILQWSTRYGGNRADHGADLALDGRGGLYVTGSVTGEQGTERMIVLRYDTNGTRYWADVLSGNPNYNDRGVTVRTAGSNFVYAAGVTVVNGYDKIVVIKYTHNDAPGAPTIVSAPQDQTVLAGNNASFSVIASGSSPLLYQWYFNGDIIPGANASTLTVAHADTTSAGSYAVEVSNPVGQAASADAFLTVHVPARIVSGPEDRCVVAGSHAVFNITFEGEGQIDIHWSHNGVPVAGGYSLLSIPNVSMADAGIYSVTVSNEYGAMTASARLMITPQATLAWARTYNSTNTAHDQATAGTVDAQGNTYITGSGPGGIQTVKFNSNGTPVWASSYGGNNGYAFANAIAVGQDGSVYVAGASQGENDLDFATVKYDPNGHELWVAHYNHGGYDQANTIAVDPAGNVYVSGTGSTSGYAGGDIVTLKYDSAGNQLWMVPYAGPDGGEDGPVALTVDNAGNVYVTGYSTEADTIAYYAIADYATIKYSSDGEELWVARHNGPGAADDRPSAIAVDSSGNVYVTGSHSYNYSVNSGTTVYYDYDYATIKYNSSGEQLWLAVYAGKRPQPDRAADLKVDAAGNVYVTGVSEGDIVTVKYGSNGQEQWVARVDGGAPYDVMSKLALDQAGNVYVTGHSGDYGDILTFRLDANGSRVWLARYDGPGGTYGSYDYPVGLGVDMAGNVFVPGSVDSATTSRDYVALKYAVSTAAGAPVITLPPHQQSATVGGTATFSVAATGDAPLYYQWRHNGVALAGETNSTLELSGVSVGDAGRYSVLVFNDVDCAVSAEVRLSVSMPAIVQCTAIERLPGGTIRLIIVGPPSYSYRIEATADFHSWQTIGSVYNSEGMCEYIDGANPSPGRRFYRVVKQP